MPIFIEMRDFIQESVPGIDVFGFRSDRLSLTRHEVKLVNEPSDSRLSIRNKLANHRRQQQQQHQMKRQTQPRQQQQLRQQQFNLPQRLLEKQPLQNGKLKGE